MNKVTLYFNQYNIGVATLDHEDSGMGTAWGQFNPSPEYARVEGVFRKWRDAQIPSEQEPVNQEKADEYYRERDALGLVVRDETGQRLDVEFVHIEDHRDIDDEAIELTVSWSSETM